MAYVVAPLINWGSIRRAVIGGARRLRREAHAFGIVGGGASGSGSGHRGAGGGAAAASDDGGGCGGVALTACADCGVDPAKASFCCCCGCCCCCRF